MSIIVTVKYRVKQGKREELLSFVEENVKKTREEQGNLAYAHYPSLDDENEMFVFEMWEDQEHIDSHTRSAHFLEFAKRRKPILEAYEVQRFHATEI